MRVLPFVVLVNVGLAVGCSSSTSPSATNAASDGGGGAASDSGVASGGSTEQDAGGTGGASQLSCSLSMPIQGAVSGTLEEPTQAYGPPCIFGNEDAIAQVQLSAAYSANSNVILKFPTPPPTTAGDAMLDSVEISLQASGSALGQGFQKWQTAQGACSVHIDQVQTSGAALTYKGTGSCQSPAIFESTGSDAGEEDASSGASNPGTITVGAFSFVVSVGG